ncbi:hypothetical protein GOL24_22260 [Sinorhizobium medicae]|uniref:hypothetical protein n=1 Tax=Sinorhizobium medicae TaxID=110321 RepID=UPI000FD51B3B|nr:hypothetical protein [Sinorhizobium medicae]MDX0410104.1 hypothetical protein [Sinorhizobium medicae]MDX0471202.1 hypothetical protein [Sinorhizobium medicae]MDX0665344.1 hypothetical protein [Sinorhizobium medicae]MDX1126996.1 hypothetical protein [Sinorhizobium medicae]MDX1230328.1 hypothetical protein [Sinorhizobium medicae]
MSNGDEKVCGTVRDALTAHKMDFQEADIQHATKFTVKSGAQSASINVYNSGKLHVEGKISELKTWLDQLKESIEKGTGGPVALLPAEIEKFPQTLRERVPDCDDVVLWFFQESLRCYKADSVAGAAFMLGAASEKAILLLIDAYATAIVDEGHRNSFLSRVNNRMISKKYDEFKASYAGCKSKPTDQLLAQDLTQLLDGAFNFYRHTRNAVGHPQIVPDLEKGVILANLGQFIIYIDRIYMLMRHFQKNGVVV